MFKISFAMFTEMLGGGQDLLRDFCGHWDPGLAYQGPEETAHCPQILDIHGPKLGHGTKARGIKIRLKSTKFRN